MQGSIEQSIGLTIAGNAFIQGHDIGRFWPESPIFVFCESVRFVEAAKGLNPGQETLAAPNPLAWFRGLAKDCKGLRLHAVARERVGIADWRDVALVGGGSIWLIESVGCSKPSLWSDNWTFSDGAAPQERPWSVTYRGNSSTGALPTTIPDLDEIEQELMAALATIAAFARRINSHFSKFFEEALAILEAKIPRDPGFALTLGPPGFVSPQGERLLIACRKAWVFGGMGAWNDGAYEGVEGDRLTDVLYSRLQAALAAAASATCAH